eukprot:scaffold33233_cov59-Phaeocystis_antarctica.AAC.2
MQRPACRVRAIRGLVAPAVELGLARSEHQQELSASCWRVGRYGELQLGPYPTGQPLRQTTYRVIAFCWRWRAPRRPRPRQINR